MFSQKKDPLIKKKQYIFSLFEIKLVEYLKNYKSHFTIYHRQFLKIIHLKEYWFF